MENSFTEKDVEKLVKFLNFINDKADFNNMKITDIITAYGLLAFCQTELKAKLEAHVFEVKKVVNAPEAKETKKSK